MFASKRLIFQKLTSADAAALYRNHQEAALRKWLPNEVYQDLAEAEQAIAFFADHVDKQSLPYVIGIFHKEQQILIGEIGVNEVAGSAHEIELGYSICEACRGQGYASEAVQAMLVYLAEHLQIHKLQGRVLKGNLASIRVLEKNRFTFVKEERTAPDDPYGEGILIYKK